MDDDSRGAEDRRTGAPSRAVLALRDSLLPLLRWLGAHIKGFYGAIGVFLVLGIIFTVGGLWLFAFLADAVMEGETRQLDRALMVWLNARSTPTLDIVALEVTTLGGAVVVWMTVLVSSAFLWVTRHRYSVLLLWVAVLGGNLLSSLLKMTFDRPRPDLFEWLTPYAGMSSFPSGHSTSAMVVYTTLAYLIARLESTRRLRIMTYSFAGVVIIMIGISRVYLGVHYPSDVIGGYLVGFTWATFCALGIETIRYFRARDPRMTEHERDLDAPRDSHPREQEIRIAPSEPRTFKGRS
ncbi:MAG TPA: phosphatase PAP2 family protein [Longimicrobiaceae bacterium]|nr:phosphatase PAP2 family protein [Longimicrobiaceae bacterium]